MTTQGNVAELIDGETHHAHMWNEKNMHYWTNKSGSSVTSGDVVIQDTTNAEAFKTTSSQGDVKVAGVIPQKDDVNGTAADQTIADNTAGMVQFVGDISKVNVDGATAIGDCLVASATAKKAHSVGAAWQPGVFARATSSSAGPGTVSAWLFPVHSQPAPWSPGNYKLHAGSTLETGWLWCDGTAVSRTTYAALFAVIGTTYGAGDGVNTFNVPDLRGRSPVGLGTHADVNALGDNDGIAVVGNRTPKHAHPQNYTGTWPDEGGWGNLVSLNPSGGEFFGHLGGGGSPSYKIQTGVSSAWGGYQVTNWMIKT